MTPPEELALISYRFQIEDWNLDLDHPRQGRQYLRVFGDGGLEVVAQKAITHYCDDMEYRQPWHRDKVSVQFLGYNVGTFEVPTDGSLDILMSVQPYGDGGWSWDTQHYGEDMVREYRTDRRGQGLWTWQGAPSPSWQQQRGHMQFGLSAGTQAEAEAELARRFGLIPRAVAYPENAGDVNAQAD